MNNGRTRPETGTTTRQQTSATRDIKTVSASRETERRSVSSSSNYSSNDRDRNNHSGSSNYTGNDRRPNGNGNGSNYTGNDRDRRPNSNGNYNRNDRDRNDRNGNYNHNDRDRNNYSHHNDRDRGHDNYSHHNDRDRNNYSHHNDRDRGHNAYRDHYSWNYHHNNWSRPLPPPARAYRPAPYYYRRPHIPAGWRPYHGAPVIDRILGITFGTLFNASLNYLYTNGYDIDGYENNVVYLRNVNMLNLAWGDVMLCYDDYGRLYNAQFIHSTYYNDRSRYNRLYHDLSAIYGSPIDYERNGVTWFGGNSVGYVTLTITNTGSRYYTNLYIGN